MEKTIREFLSKDYKDFSLYTIESRAIPSLVDGFKTVQRKIIHICNNTWKSGSEKPLKVFQLAGKVASESYYHHGNQSLENAIINVAQSFKNNMPLLDEVGQFGSLRAPESGASRYIGTKLNKNFRLLYRDFELLEYKEEEGVEIEPKYFLPIIPTILVNGSSGIAVGFATNILNRDPIEIISACESVLSGQNSPNTSPSKPNFNGTYERDPENNKKWYIKGIFKKTNTTTVRVTELPPSMTYEKYESILDSLVESKQIVSYDDNCKDSIDYTIKFTRESLSKLSDDDISKLLKLSESETENFTTLDEFNKLRIFESDSDIIEYFVNFRLVFYTKRKEYLLGKMANELKVLSNRGKFIKAILDEKLEIRSKQKTEILHQLESLGLEMIDGSYDYLLRMPLWSLTKEVFDKLKLDFSDKKSEIEDLKKRKPNEMYLSDLSELKIKLS